MVGEPPGAEFWVQCGCDCADALNNPLKWDKTCGMPPKIKPIDFAGAGGYDDSKRQTDREKGSEHVEARPANRLEAIAQAKPASVAGEVTNGHVPAPPAAVPRTGRVFPPWLRRRWWVLALCLIAGTGGGFLARHAQTVKYSGQAELSVASGAGSNGPGPANDAIALALTDAAIIPSDQSTLQRVSSKTGIALSKLEKNLTASSVDGTSLILMGYKSSTPSSAVVGVNAAARILHQGTPDSAIPADSLDIVELASSASPVGSIHSYGIPLGVLLGFLIGAIALLAMERADPRIDSVDDLAEVTGTAASVFPGSIPVVELERNIARASGGANVTLAPLSDGDEDQAWALQRQLTVNAHSHSLLFEVGSSVTSRSGLLAQDAGPTVLVVTPNARSRVVQASVRRLQMMGRDPVWAVLAVGRPSPEFPA
jgi:capsular polysaccharide biosynthesis protein